MASEIPESTRRAIVDCFARLGAHWSGRLAEDEFLSRLFDLSELPSKDVRFANAAQDIRQHTFYWDDWASDWVFYDDRFNLLRGPDEVFLRFLCETVHPVVRVDLNQAEALVQCLNEHLRKHGWQLIQDGELWGRPKFTASKLGEPIRVLREPTGWEKVDGQLQQARYQLETAKTETEFQAVGLLCREVLISLAQAVYNPDKYGTPDGVRPSNTDAPKMLEAVLAKELQGSANEEARRYAKAAWALAVALQHKRTADFRMAALCAEATASLVNVIALVVGRWR